MIRHELTSHEHEYEHEMTLNYIIICLHYFLPTSGTKQKRNSMSSLSLSNPFGDDDDDDNTKRSVQNFENGNYSDCDNESDSASDDGSDNEIDSLNVEKKTKSPTVDITAALSGKSHTSESSTENSEEVSSTSMTKKLMSKFF